MIESSKAKLDVLDRKILNVLQTEGRLSNAELAKRLNLSPPATHARVKRLEHEGIIHQYAALVDRHRLGIDTLCFVEFSLQLHSIEQIQSILATVNSWPEVLECHNVTGEYDYLLKVAVRNTQALESFISQRMIPLDGVARIHTSMVLKEVKSTTAIILEE
ncbi:Lrp/AsnC family transcriptional regulator [Kangiella marina]|uniref:Lrp/AsnC family transcriptional regulator n=1 Tax=Kangiella marina TaxID=1079178 RepID=A0ABP8IAC6_9GAMM